MKIDPTTNKIEAIKALRVWTEETFGRAAGLSEAKALVDYIIAAKNRNKSEIERSNRVRMILLDVDPSKRYELYHRLLTDMNVLHFIGIDSYQLDDAQLLKPIVG